VFIDAEVLMVLTEQDCKDIGVCSLLDIYKMGGKKADGSGYKLYVGLITNGVFDLVKVNKNGLVNGSVKVAIYSYCQEKEREELANQLLYRGVVVGDDKFVLMFSDDMKGIGEKLLRDKLEVIRRVWITN